MEIFIEFSSMRRFKKLFYLIADSYKGKDISFHIVFNEKRSYYKPFVFLRKKGYKIVEFIVYTNRYLKKIIKRINKRKVHPSLYVRGNKNAIKYKKILYRINSLTNFEDMTNDDNYSVFSKNKFLLIKDKNHNEIYENQLINLSIENYSNYNCEHASCLGSTLFISKRNDVSFCPKRPQETIIGKATELDKVFLSQKYLQVLEKAVSKRKQCIEKCEKYDLCQGGCPLQECTSFLEDFYKVEKYINDVIDKKTSLASVPYRYKVALINYISKANNNIK